MWCFSTCGRKVRALVVLLGQILAVTLLGMTACSDSGPTGLGISRSTIQSEFSYFDFEPLPRSVAQSAVIGRKFPEIAAMTGEVVELTLIGPTQELTEATVIFSTRVDSQDTLDVGAFIRLVAPDVDGVGWAIDDSLVKSLCRSN